MDKKNIFVTQPSLPPLREFIPYLEKIWENKVLTNNGPFHQQLEQELCKYLGVKYISLFSNGTLALLAALNALNIKGEVITTPYSFVATAHSLLWNNNKPVFIDVDPVNFNLDPEKIEAAITPKTSAILPVHVYGNPCDVKKIDEIAKKYKLKVVYDACHAFGVKIDNNSIFNFGDISVVSFHATKVFNTFEGGAVICHDSQTKYKLDNFKNFGIRPDFTSETIIDSLGLNAKMNEVGAVMGLLQLRYIDENIEKRKKAFELYRKKLVGIKGISFLNDIVGVKHNYSYFPIIVNKDEYGQDRNNVIENLKKKDIFSRPYFSPLINQFDFYKEMGLGSCEDLPIALNISKSILCLPIYADLEENDIELISEIIKLQL